MKSITVNLEYHKYDILIENNLLDNIGVLIKKYTNTKNVLSLQIVMCILFMHKN